MPGWFQYVVDDASLEITILPLQNSECSDFNGLIPVELIYSSSVASQRSDIYGQWGLKFDSYHCVSLYISLHFF